MLKIVHPPTYIIERHYIFDIIMYEFLGLDWCAEVNDCQEIRISLEDDSLNRQLILPDILFQTQEANWLTKTSLPEQPIKWWKVTNTFSNMQIISTTLPIIYGRVGTDEKYFEETESKVILEIDIFGSAFFMLTRYEELVNSERDQHNRFPAHASLAYQEGFLERPIVNEYLEILWGLLKYLWPGLQRKPRSYRILLSHDVDWPLCTAGKSPAWLLKNIGGDVMRRHDASLVPRRLRAYIQARQGRFDEDPCNTFDFIMALSEKKGLQSAFYFIADHSAGEIDGLYDLNDAWIRRLMKRIQARGHEIGLHPSYGSYRDPTQTRREFERLLHISQAEGIRQARWGGRQHYLRWENPLTWQNWAEAGLDYDSTLCFADHVGFRCGICFEYPVFNLRTRQRLKLRERPLIVMERTLLSPYMNYTFEASVQKILDLGAICRQFNGDFSLLWHNDNLISKQEKLWYSTILEELI
jgi:hypothetical protein